MQQQALPKTKRPQAPQGGGQGGRTTTGFHTLQLGFLKSVHGARLSHSLNSGSGMWLVLHPYAGCTIEAIADTAPGSLNIFPEQ